MGLLMIWDDIHRHINPGGKRSKRAREWLEQHIEDNWFTETWFLKVGEKIIEKKINKKHNVICKQNDLNIKNILDQIKVEIGRIK